MLIFEGRHASSLAAVVIIAIQDTLAQGSTSLIQASILIISI